MKLKGAFELHPEISRKAQCCKLFVTRVYWLYLSFAFSQFKAKRTMNEWIGHSYSSTFESVIYFLPVCHRCHSRQPRKLMRRWTSGVTLCSETGGLLDVTGGGGRRLAANAGRVDWLGRDQVQVLVVRYLIQAVPVLQQLDVEILVDLLQEMQVVLMCFAITVVPRLTKFWKKVLH